MCVGSTLWPGQTTACPTPLTPCWPSGRCSGSGWTRPRGEAPQLYTAGEYTLRPPLVKVMPPQDSGTQKAGYLGPCALLDEVVMEAEGKEAVMQLGSKDMRTWMKRWESKSERQWRKREKQPEVLRSIETPPWAPVQGFIPQSLCFPVYAEAIGELLQSDAQPLSGDSQHLHQTMP